MNNQEQRPRRGNAKAVEADTLSPSSTAPSPPPQEPEAVGPVDRYRLADIVHKLLWDRRDIARLTGLSVRLFEREVSAGRAPLPDLRIGRRTCWRPSTVLSWLDDLAAHEGRRSWP
jgi:hypothetical protein